MKGAEEYITRKISWRGGRQFRRHQKALVVQYQRRRRRTHPRTRPEDGPWPSPQLHCWRSCSPTILPNCWRSPRKGPILKPTSLPNSYLSVKLWYFFHFNSLLYLGYFFLINSNQIGSTYSKVLNILLAISYFAHVMEMLFGLNKETLGLVILLRLRLGGENEMEWKGMERIILEYSSLPSFESFNEGNGKLIPLFRSLSKRKWNG